MIFGHKGAEELQGKLSDTQPDITALVVTANMLPITYVRAQLSCDKNSPTIWVTDQSFLSFKTNNAKHYLVPASKIHITRILVLDTKLIIIHLQLCFWPSDICKVNR